MDTFKKIWKLIPDNWEEVLTQASEFEQQLDTAQQTVPEFEGIAREWISKLLPGLQVNWKEIQSQLERTRFYHELEKVKIDIPALMTIPQDFNWEREDHRMAFLDDKSTLLKQSLKDVTYQQKNGAIVDLNLAVDRFRELVDVLMDELAKINTGGLDVGKYKAEIQEKIRPIIYDLVQIFTGHDLMSQPAEKDAPSVDDRFLALISMVEEFGNSKPEGVRSDLPDDVASAIRTLSRIQHALPLMQNQLHNAAPEFQPVLQYFGELENVVDRLGNQFPAIAEAVQNLLKGDNWEDLKIETLATELKSLFTMISTFLHSSPLTTKLLDLLIHLKGVLPIKWVGFEEGTAFEEKLLRWFIEGKELFKLPAEIDSMTPDQLLNWFKEKFDAFIHWINHVAFIGFTFEDLYQPENTSVEQFFSADGEDLNSTEGIVALLLNKLMMILDWTVPILGGKDESEPPIKDHNHSTGDDSSLKTEKSSPGVLLPFVRVLRDSLEKGQLIWQFFKKNELKFHLEDQPQDFRSAALLPTSFQVNSGAVDGSPEKNGETETSQKSTYADSDKEMHTSGTETQGAADSSANARNVIHWMQVIKNLLGDRKSGVISRLTKDKQDIAILLIEETLKQQLVEDLSEVWNDSMLAETFNSYYEAFQSLKGPDEWDSAIPSVADLLLQVLQRFGHLYDLALSFLQQVIDSTLDLIFQLIDLFLAVVKEFRVPEEIKESIPQAMEETLFGDREPNFICLLVAMPTVVVKGFLTVSVEQMKNWM
jgi:hypothetical protein